MKARTPFVIFAAVALALAVAPAAMANCVPAHAFYGYDTATGATSYIVFPSTANMATMVGHFWQPDNATGNQDGPGCPVTTWLNPTADPYTFYVNGALGGSTFGDPCSNIGCPTGAMTMQFVVTDNDGVRHYQLLTQAGDHPLAAANFTFVNANGNWPVPLAAKPFVLSSSKAGSLVNVNMKVRAQDVNANYQGTADFPTMPTGALGLNSVRLYKKSSATTPSPDRSGWTLVSTVPYTGTDVTFATDPADCSNTAVDTFYAVSLAYGTSNFESDKLGDFVRVNCNPALAEPPGKFKHIDKKPPKK